MRLLKCPKCKRKRKTLQAVENKTERKSNECVSELCKYVSMAVCTPQNNVKDGKSG